MICGEVATEQCNLSESVCEMAVFVFCLVLVFRDFRTSNNFYDRVVFAVLHYRCCFVIENTQMRACVRADTHKHWFVSSGWSLIWAIVLGAAMLWDFLCVSGCWPVWKDFKQVNTNSKPRGKSCTKTELHVLHSCLTFMARQPHKR